MQIAPVLSYMPYVARPSESNGVASIASSARPSDTRQAPLPQVTGIQPPLTNNADDPRAPAATENAARAEGNEASTASARNASADGAQRTDQEATDTGEQDRQGASQDPTAPKGANGQALAPEDITELKSLQVRDREVRNHELAHQVVGGQFAGGASYTFERGPDGGRYAVAGEVPIDVGAVPGDPQATIEKMRKVRAAALAPAEPSAQDRAIAAQASQTMMAAQLELALQRREASNSEDAVSIESTTTASPLFAATQSTTQQSQDTSQTAQSESNKAVQTYQSMAPGLSQYVPSADPLWAMA
ncbi:putative metalloprotease CJM1_0395 family protein [Modicisalibacter muralis]|nr:putative metalloprotease CJM1_0395 family protein [Halomonas muralis]